MFSNPTKSTDIQSLAQTCDAAVAGRFKVNRAAAVEACANAAITLQQGDFEGAEQLAIVALKCRPACKLAYQILGQMFDKQGQSDDANECYRRRLPVRLITRYFQTVQPVSVAGEPLLRRIEVFPTERIPLPRPGSLFDQQKAPFNRKEIIANPGFVDTVSDARLWHDSSNTLVLDAVGCEIAEHTQGNVAVLRALQQNYLPQPLKGRVVLLGARGAHNYYHWMADIIPKLGILKAAGFTIQSDDLFVVSYASTSFARALLGRAGINDEQIFESEVLSPYIAADELIVPYLSNSMGYTMGQWLPDIMQKTILGFAAVEAVADRKLFVSRDANKAAGRAVDNQQAVEAFFTQRGFEIVKPEQMTIVQQAKLFSEASVVAGPHGAGLSNIVYCAPGTKVIEFYGAHIAPCYWAISALARLDYYHHCCLLGDSEDGQGVAASQRRSAGFSIPLDAAEELLHQAGC